MSAETVAITANPDPRDPDACTLRVDAELVASGTFRFSRGGAEASPLADALFALPEIEGFEVSRGRILVRKSGEASWRQVGPGLGAAVRSALATGLPLVPAELQDALPAEQILREAVEAVLEAEINPGLAHHNGHVRLVDVRGNDVFVNMGGGCQGCGFAGATLQDGVERMLRERIPGMGQLIDTTDHDAGENPYIGRTG
ncbi:MAG: NifU family protein [Alphaproteobacteria bacterium]|nr:NifU family protein [Alphaproteobacteria bacterium]